MSRLARIAYAFVLMNYAAVAGLFALASGRQIWIAPAAPPRRDQPPPRLPRSAEASAKADDAGRELVAPGPLER